ncbi:MAG TPA: hypothetical protein VII73_08800 [Caulobacteraceae bacterium]
MRTKTATLTLAAAALATGPALAATSVAPAPATPVAASYAELLQPIPNAVERLELANAEAASAPRLIEAQYVTPVAHHHHHHHSHHNRSWYRSHGYLWSGGAWMLRPVRRAHHHHHHHHHHSNY